LSSILAKAQCEVDSRFAASASFELTSDWGFIAQAGITGGQLPFSVHLGVRAGEIVDSSVGKQGNQSGKFFPRLELGYRIIDGLHLNVGIAKDKDVSITAYSRIGEKLAVYGRGLYNGALMFAMGVKILFYRM
jgi:hypothetical protein